LWSGEVPGRETARVTDAPDDLARSQYARMLWNTPLSTDHANLLLERLDPQAGSEVLDLGCGWGELLMRAVLRADAGSAAATTGIGVDTDLEVLQRGRGRAIDLGLGAQVRFVAQTAASWRQPADRVLCIGSSHAWSGAEQALAELADLVPAGGRLLFGDGCWETPPTPAAAEVFGADVSELDTLVRQATRAGWHVLHMSTADQREWDDFEATWRAGRQEWLLDNPSDARAAEVRRTLDRQLEEYLTIYRGVLGFCYLVLGR
jgi:SAM-dependent methyltransferase